MDSWNDLEDMGQSSLGAALAERLLTGGVASDDAPLGFDRIAALIGTAQGPATEEELSAEPEIVLAFATRAQAPSVIRGRAKRRPWLFRFPAKVLGVAVPVAFLGAGVAAATGSLPPSAQSAVSRVLSDIGISVPNPQNASDEVEGPLHLDTPGGMAVDGSFDTASGSPSLSDPCTSWKSGNLSHHSTTYRDLVAAAGSARAIAAYCQGIPVSVAPGSAATNARVRTPNQPNNVSHGASINRPARASNRAGSSSKPRGRSPSALCAAWGAGGLAPQSVAYRNIAAAAGGAENLTAYCGVTPRSSIRLGTTISPGNPGDSGRTASPGKSGNAKRGHLGSSVHNSPTQGASTTTLPASNPRALPSNGGHRRSPQNSRPAFARRQPKPSDAPGAAPVTQTTGGPCTSRSKRSWRRGRFARSGGELAPAVSSCSGSGRETTGSDSSMPPVTNRVAPAIKSRTHMHRQIK